MILIILKYIKWQQVEIQGEINISDQVYKKGSQQIWMVNY